jgi:hypothetical protein
MASKQGSGITMSHLRAFAVLAISAVALTSPLHAQTARHYDCSKAGNANKAVCKGAAPAAQGAVATRTTIARHYDCTKAGNANKAVCKGSAATTTAASVTPAPAPAAPVRTTATHTVITSYVTHSATTNASGPNGAAAQCKDGTYSHSQHRSGTCAGHKGVQTWY